MFSEFKIVFFSIASFLSVVIFFYIKFILEIDIFTKEIISIEKHLENDVVFVILIFCFFTLMQIFFIPGSILTVLISVILSSQITFFLMFITGLITACIQYKLSSTINKNPRTKLQLKIQFVSNKIKNKGLLILIILRLLPGIPFSTFNLTCGILNIKFSYFIISFIFGIGPKILLYSNFINIIKF